MIQWAWVGIYAIKGIADLPRQGNGHSPTASPVRHELQQRRNGVCECIPNLSADGNEVPRVRQGVEGDRRAQHHVFPQCATFLLPNLDLMSLDVRTDTIHKIIVHTYRTIRRAARTKASIGQEASFAGFRSRKVAWLGYHAFLVVLSRKPKLWRPILAHLVQLDRFQGETRNTRTRLKRVISHPSNKALQGIRY